VPSLGTGSTSSQVACVASRTSRRDSTPASSIAGSSAPVSIARLMERIRCGAPGRRRFTRRPAIGEPLSCCLGTASSKARFAISVSRSTVRSASRSSRTLISEGVRPCSGRGLYRPVNGRFFSGGSPPKAAACGPGRERLLPLVADGVLRSAHRRIVSKGGGAGPLLFVRQAGAAQTGDAGLFSKCCRPMIGAVVREDGAYLLY
jgi:hypothetical protein